MKKKLAQILAVVLAVSCFSGCTLILEDGSDNGSESGYLESVESGDSGSSGNEITVDIESEKVNSEAEWNAAFDYDFSQNYVAFESSSSSEAMQVPDGEGNKITISVPIDRICLYKIDKASKRVEVKETEIMTVQGFGKQKDVVEHYMRNKNGETFEWYGYNTWLYREEIGEELVDVEEGKWKKLNGCFETQLVWHDECGDYLLWNFINLFGDDDDDWRFTGESAEFSEEAYVEFSEYARDLIKQNFSYSKFTYNQEEKVYVATEVLSAENFQYQHGHPDEGVINAYVEDLNSQVKVWIKDGKIAALSIDFNVTWVEETRNWSSLEIVSVEKSKFEVAQTFLFGAADIECPPFEYEEEDSSQASA